VKDNIKGKKIPELGDLLITLNYQNNTIDFKFTKNCKTIEEFTINFAKDLTVEKIIHVKWKKETKEFIFNGHSYHIVKHPKSTYNWIEQSYKTFVIDVNGYHFYMDVEKIENQKTPKWKLINVRTPLFGNKM
jgi:carbonic anhydrase